jgi:hypothetical protein
MNWFRRGIEFTASLLFVRWVSRIRFNMPGWVLLLLAFLSVLAIIFWGLVK